MKPRGLARELGGLVVNSSVVTRRPPRRMLFAGGDAIQEGVEIFSGVLPVKRPGRSAVEVLEGYQPFRLMAAWPRWQEPLSPTRDTDGR